MKFLKVLLLLVGVVTGYIHSLKAQSDNADSVYSMLQSGSLNDKEKLVLVQQVLPSLVLHKSSLAIQLCRQFLPLAESNKNPVAQGELLRFTGLAHLTLGLKDSAALYFEAARQRHQQAHNPRGVGDCLINLARMNRKLKKLDEALRYYDEAEKLFRDLKDASKIAEVLNESGVAFEYKENYEEAIRRYSASLAIQQQRKDSVGIGYALEFLGGVFGLKHEYGKASQYLFEALQYRKDTKDTFALALNYTAIGDLFNKQNQLPQALHYYTISNELTQKISYTDLMMYNYGELSALQEKKGHLAEAMKSLKLHLQLKDSLNNAQKIKQLDELNVQYETEKNKGIIQQQKMALLRRNALVAGIAGLLLLSSMLFYFVWRSNKMKHAARLQQEILKQQELTTQAVIKAEEEERQRIARDLHDGVGQMMAAARMNVSALESMLQPEAQEAQKAFQKIAALVDDSVREVRAVSHNMMPNALLKNSLAAAIRDFIDKLDHKKLQVQLYTEGLEQRLNSDVETVFYRVIQECVNNVIKHADANKLHISIIKDEEGINAMVEDNGIGFDSRNPQKFKGIGVKNILTRVHYLKGTVDFDSTPGKGTLVAIFVPLTPDA